MLVPTSRYRWLAMFALLGLAGCQVHYALWIEEGSTSSNLVFRVSQVDDPLEPVRITGLSVTPKPCSDRLVPFAPDIWRINGMGVAGETSSISYGQTPAGWEEVVRAAPLTAGCYVAWGPQLPPRFFRVESDGRITDQGSRSGQQG